jgi:hypothetical protein
MHFASALCSYANEIKMITLSGVRGTGGMIEKRVSYEFWGGGMIWKGLFGRLKRTRRSNIEMEFMLEM